MLNLSVTLRLYLVAIVTVGAVVACDRVPLTSPTGSSISISVERSVLPLNGQTVVRAIVTESSGTPVHNGTEVTFQSSIGAVNPPSAQTINGVATATFIAGTLSGTGVIHAFSGGARTGSGNSSSGGASVSVGAAAAGSISLSATPPSVSQSGGTVTISALVLDSGSNPLPGVSVIFSANAGALSATSALTDEGGIARTTLQTTQNTTVTARTGSVTPATVDVVVSAAPTVSIEVTPASPIAGVPVAITVTASSGTTANPRQVQTLELDFGDGTRETRSNVTGTAAFTHTYSTAGGYTITARAVDVAGNTGVGSRAIVVARAAAPTVTLTMTPNPADVNQIVGFSVTSTTTSGLPVENIRVFINGELAYSTTGSSGAFTRGFSATGTYTVIAEAVDSSGNVGRTQAFLIVEP